MMRYFTITVNGVSYQVTVEENNAPTVPAAPASPAAPVTKASAKAKLDIAVDD